MRIKLHTNIYLIENADENGSLYIMRKSSVVNLNILYIRGEVQLLGLTLGLNCGILSP